MPKLLLLLINIFISFSITANASNWTLRGYSEIEQFYFFEKGLQGQNRNHQSFVINPQWLFSETKHYFIVEPFYRWDSEDEERSHFDIRALAYQIHEGSWELRLGIKKIFWGVTEAQHLVDIINQTDVVESIDGEEKLGQPMVNYSYQSDYGLFDFFLLLGFRERTFAGERGRFRLPILVATDNAQYESNAEEKHIDVALRWEQQFDLLDLGVSFFQGTGREPILNQQVQQNALVLIPYYQQIQQTGVDFQMTLDQNLVKLETIYRHSDLEHFWASTSGFEYTFYGILNSNADMGWLLEYLYDQRGINGTSWSEDDWFLGGRITFNDTSGSELLTGFLYDPTTNELSWQLEFNRRIKQNYRIELEAGWYNEANNTDKTYFLNEDHFIRLILKRYF